MKQIATVVGVLFVLISLSTFAHGDIHERIKAISKEIKASPNEPSLYLKRAELYIKHEDFRKSNRDLKKCNALGLDSDRIKLNYAINYRNLKHYVQALEYLDEILMLDVKNVKALKEKGNVLFDQKKYDEAAIFYEKVTEVATDANPDNFIEASKAWELDDKIGSLARSKNIIVEGIDKLGDLMVFYQRLVQLNLLGGEYEQAIFNQTKIVDLSTRKEKALFQRALIYIESNDLNKAKSDLEQSYDLIESLPSKFKQNQSTIDLRNLIVKVKKEL